MRHQKTEVANSTGESVEVGTTGTINSLMIRELQSTKHSPKTSSSHKKQQQSSPVSVLCGASPRKSFHRRNSASECSTCSSRNNNSPCNDHTHQNTPRKNRNGTPMLGRDHDIDSNIKSNLNTDDSEKKVRSHLVEVVDVKCSYTMGRKLKKLGFSKLSESNS